MKTITGKHYVYGYAGIFGGAFVVQSFAPAMGYYMAQGFFNLLGGALIVLAVLTMVHLWKN
jgi:hypothetical protein